MAWEQRLDCIVVGAGAAGIGIGAVLKEIGLTRYCILERGTIGSSFRAWPEEMRLITPSFTGNAYGMLDLNAVTLHTSPSYTLGTEHPTGREYAEYLQAVSDYHQLSVRTGVDVLDVQRHEDGFRLDTSEGMMYARFVIWAAGEYQYPRVFSIPGSEYGIHNSQIVSWQQLDGDDWVIIGGYESGVDAAIHLSRLGKKVTILERRSHLLNKGSSDPSVSLSPYTKDRLRAEMKHDRITFIGNCNVQWIEPADGGGYVMYCEDEHGGRHQINSPQPPILATGFDGSLRRIDHLLQRDERGQVLLGRADESMVTPGLFVSGPNVMHGQLMFCFIYKFRQRFAVIAQQIGNELGLDVSVLETYRKEHMFLDDLSCCGESCTC
ncbi:NAD(P)/FAD-dependent oxidoreductase [Paenibacillus sp. WLX1005]|uniref:NAD(P)/FAD-dependent oxidoreductase n=1 Tax=Paenibacillus sp. WLX1005 TaxID=3243766 RepID=UPI0039843CA3